MVIIDGKRNSRKYKSAKKSAGNNTGVDKHKAWLIGGISVAILVVAMLVLFPALKGPVAGQAILTGEEGLVLDQVGSSPVHDGVFTYNEQPYEVYVFKSSEGVLSNLNIVKPGDQITKLFGLNQEVGNTYTITATDSTCFEVEFFC